MKEDSSDKMSVIIEGFAEMAELMSIMLESVNGYRAQCLAAGYSETAAEVMAMQYHMVILQTSFGMKSPQL